MFREIREIKSEEKLTSKERHRRALRHELFDCRVGGERYRQILAELEAMDLPDEIDYGTFDSDKRIDVDVLPEEIY